LAGRRESCSPLREQVKDDGALKRAACPSEKEFDNSIAVLGGLIPLYKNAATGYIKELCRRGRIAASKALQDEPRLK